MDIQGYIPPSEEHGVHHYAESQSSLEKNNTVHTMLPTLVEEDSKYYQDEDYEDGDDYIDPCPSSSQAVSKKPRRLNPALMLNRYDKRKSSPAILGLPFGLKHENQLSVHLSQQRNSIEAAMLLANFNKLMPKPNEIEQKGNNIGQQQQWQDDMSIPQNKSSWGDDSSKKSKRRYSYDMKMSWQTMPDSFLDRSDLLSKSPPPLPPPTIKQEPKIYDQPNPYEMRMYHPNQPIAPHGYRYHPPPPPLHPHQQEHMPMLHPLSRPQDLKREDPPQAYYTYSFPPQHAMGQRYFYPVTNPKLPLPPNGAIDATGSYQPALITKRKKKRYMEDDEEIAANEDEFPDMAVRDVEAARKDPEARPRKQKLRFTGDQYTPQWVRYNGQSKEGLCDTCKPGKWLQLKNSAYWYHKQFFHGISSVSGKEFVQPLETRWMDQDLVEGLCHQCHSWVACHVYHKPKSATPKKR